MLKLTKGQIAMLNELAKNDFTRAQHILEGANMALGTQYGWLNRRVVFFDNPNGSTAEKYAHVHDAYVYAE